MYNPYLNHAEREAYEQGYAFSKGTNNVKLKNDYDKMGYPNLSKAWDAGCIMSMIDNMKNWFGEECLYSKIFEIAKCDSQESGFDLDKAGE